MSVKEPVSGRTAKKTDKVIKKSVSKPRGKNGGKRPGAGRKPGYKSPKTLEADATKRAFNARILQNSDKLLNAAMNVALGETYLMRKVTIRNKKGTVTKEYHEVVTDPQTIIDYLDNGQDGSFGDDDEWYYMTTRTANVNAIKELFDRAFGKPKGDEDDGNKGLVGIVLSDSQAEQLLRIRTDRSTV